MKSLEDIICVRIDGTCTRRMDCTAAGCCLDDVTETDLVAAQEAYVDARDARRALFRRAHDTGWTYRAIGEAVKLTGPGIWHLLHLKREKDG